MNFDNLLEQCHRLIDAYASILHIPAVEVVFYSKENKNQEYSKNILQCIKYNDQLTYIPEDNVIFFNLDLFFEPKMLPLIIAHEMYHSYQIYCINHKEEMEEYELADVILLWEQNYYHYISDQTSSQYELQELELFAIMFSSVISSHIYDEMLERVSYLMKQDELCPYILEDLLDKYPQEWVEECFKKHKVNINIFIKLDAILHQFLKEHKGM